MLKLLIVPYGIETNDNILSKHLNLLLIVPYGIETPDRDMDTWVRTYF